MMKKLWFYTITLLSLLLAGCNNGDDGLLDIPSGWSHNAESLVVTPKNASVPVGLTQQMHADAVLPNSVVVDVTTNEALTWRSSDPTIATVDTQGLVKGVEVGTVTITAEGVNNDGSVVKDTATLTVTNAEVVNLLVTPEVDTTVVGVTKPFKATAILSTGATQDVTNEAALSWTSSNTDIATIDANGIATGLAVGEVTITATGTIGGNELSDTATLTVTNAEVVNLLVTPEVDTTAVGLTKPFKATAILSTGGTLDVTNEAALSWTSSNTDIATIDANGIATGLAVGEVTITATGTIGGNELSDTATLTVTNAEVVNLLVTPEVDTTVVGVTKPFKATAILSTGATQDVTNEAALSWTSSNTDIATIDANGIATGLAVGEVTITATGTIDGNEFSDTATLTVIGTRKIVQVNSKYITEDNPLYFQDIPLGNGITEMERFDPLQISLYEVISQDDTKIRRDTVCKLFIDQDNYLDVESNTLKPMDELSTTVEIQERDGLTEGNDFNIALLFTHGFDDDPYIRFRFEFDCEGELLEAFSGIYYYEAGS
ncbi:hypothetical protein BC462_11865 [Vibrio parahaemolyticus]|uniref:Ig-like domain-containing protein n=4 Tax=Vibrio parahaemolyticus TaxID=670 RepID=UPI00223EE05E|nr:Ig-like domain-containing protein [Vibrio parahaemolyticus]MCW7948918.1 hypothetical protein [Vibrio parahaemolyticus]